MKAPSSGGAGKSTVSKAKTTKPKPKPTKTYTAKQQAAYAYLKQKYPFTQASFNAWKKAHPFKNQKSAGKNSSKGKAGTVSRVTGTTTKRTLSLNGHRITEENVQLGRNKPYSETEKPRLSLDKYLTASVPPAVVDYASEVASWPMYGNDTIGDCTCACVGHQIQAWTRYTGAEVTVPQEDIIQLYSAVSGYDPATGANDTGATCQDVLTYWRKSGVPVAGHKILAFAQLTDLSKVKDALCVFGSVYLGIQFPQSATDQFNADEPWDVVQGSPIEGGHAIPLQYAGTGSCPYQVVTWGKLQGMTQAFLDAYCEEAWVIVTDDWLEKNGHTPEGLDLAQLGADLSQLTGDPNPFTPPAPAPPAPAPSPAPAPGPSVLQDVEKVAGVLLNDAPEIIAAVEKVL